MCLYCLLLCPAILCVCACWRIFCACMLIHDKFSKSWRECVHEVFKMVTFARTSTQHNYLGETHDSFNRVRIGRRAGNEGLQLQGIDQEKVSCVCAQHHALIRQPRMAQIVLRLALVKGVRQHFECWIDQLELLEHAVACHAYQVIVRRAEAALVNRRVLRRRCFDWRHEFGFFPRPYRECPVWAASLSHEELRVGWEGERHKLLRKTHDSKLSFGRKLASPFVMRWRGMGLLAAWWGNRISPQSVVLWCDANKSLVLSDHRFSSLSPVGVKGACVAWCCLGYERLCRSHVSNSQGAAWSKCFCVFQPQQCFHARPHHVCFRKMDRGIKAHFKACQTRHGNQMLRNTLDPRVSKGSSRAVRYAVLICCFVHENLISKMNVCSTIWFFGRAMRTGLAQSHQPAHHVHTLIIWGSSHMAV